MEPRIRATATVPASGLLRPHSPQHSAKAPKFHIDTYDVDSRTALDSRPSELVWGGGARVALYQIGTVPFSFDPSGRDLFIGLSFVRTASRSLRQ